MTSRILPSVALGICALVFSDCLVLKTAFGQAAPSGPQTQPPAYAGQRYGAFSAGPSAAAASDGRYDPAQDSMAPAGAPSNQAPSAPALIREYQLEAPLPEFQFAAAPASPADVPPVYRSSHAAGAAADAAPPAVPPGTNVIRGEMFLAAQSAGVALSPSHGPGHAAPVPSQPPSVDGYGPAPRVVPSAGTAPGHLDAYQADVISSSETTRTVPQYDTLAPVAPPDRYVSQQAQQSQQALQAQASTQIDHNVAPAAFVAGAGEAASPITPIDAPQMPSPVGMASTAAQEPQPFAAAAPPADHSLPQAMAYGGDRYSGHESQAAPLASASHDHASHAAPPERFLAAPQAPYTRADAGGSGDL